MFALIPIFFPVGLQSSLFDKYYLSLFLLSSDVWDHISSPSLSIKWEPVQKQGLNLTYQKRFSSKLNSPSCPWYLVNMFKQKGSLSKSVLLGGETRAEVHPWWRQGVSNLACCSHFLLTPTERLQLASHSKKHEALRPSELLITTCPVQSNHFPSD